MKQIKKIITRRLNKNKHTGKRKISEDRNKKMTKNRNQKYKTRKTGNLQNRKIT